MMPRQEGLPSRRPERTSGYTLTELIAVLAIIAILAAAVVGVGRYAMKQGRIGKTKGTLNKLELAIGLYKEDFAQYIPDSAATGNGESLSYVLSRLRWPRIYTDALGNRRGKPSPANYDKPSEILFFFLQDMYDVMNHPDAHKANAPFLALLFRKEAYVKFRPNELKDTDGDELPEIVDGWGRPVLYVAADGMRGDRIVNIEPHADKNPESFCLYSFGPDKLGYYDGTKRGEQDYPVGDLNRDKRTDSNDQAIMRKQLDEFAVREGYSGKKVTEMANRDNITNWGREN